MHSQNCSASLHRARRAFVCSFVLLCGPGADGCVLEFCKRGAFRVQKLCCKHCPAKPRALHQDPALALQLLLLFLVRKARSCPFSPSCPFPPPHWVLHFRAPRLRSPQCRISSHPARGQPGAGHRAGAQGLHKTPPPQSVLGSPTGAGSPRATSPAPSPPVPIPRVQRALRPTHSPPERERKPHPLVLRIGFLFFRGGYRPKSALLLFRAVRQI